jgi:stearoyl-CoA desaturase (delta-9 desaturase)
MTVILVFFLVHWFASLFFQSFYHHRYAAHGMFTMSRFWDRTFNLLAVLVQGSSYLNPRAYAELHRRHHAFSDTDRDPHSPRRYGNVFRMMSATFREYRQILREGSDDHFPGYGPPPEWPALERVAGRIYVRLVFVGLYIAFYLWFATSAWLFLLLPIHILMGPIHGAIVNWCGHRYGYRNYDLPDDSRNTLPIDFVTLGELFQNNHHRNAGRANFASRAFEFDPTYALVRLLDGLGIIQLKQTARHGAAL